MEFALQFVDQVWQSSIGKDLMYLDNIYFIKSIQMSYALCELLAGQELPARILVLRWSSWTCGSWFSGCSLAGTGHPGVEQKREK